MVGCDCPGCGSARTQALSAIHVQGQRHYTRSATSWFWYRRPLGLKSTRSRGHSQSLLSKMAAPPVAPTTALLQSLFTPAVLIVAFVLGQWPLFAASLVVLVVVAVVRGRVEAAPAREALGRWEHIFYCHRAAMRWSRTHRLHL